MSNRPQTRKFNVSLKHEWPLNLENIMKKLTLSLTLLVSSFSSLAVDNNFKMAVIKGSQGATEIMSGLYLQGVESIASDTNQLDIDQRIARQMNLCVAYASLKQMQDAQKACDQAIALTENYKERSGLAKNIASLALSNRAILRTKVQDYEGALQDLMAAMEVKNSKVIKENLIHFIKHKREQIQFKPQQITKV